MPLENLFEEARRVLDEASQRNVTLKLFGGMAIYTGCPSARNPPFSRKYVDIDVMGRSKQSDDVKKLFVDLQYSPRAKFNAMYGDRRLVFNDPEHNRRVDVFLDVFEMCHKIDMRERLLLDGPTLPLADLLATKLQVVEINEKDFKDIACVMLDHEIGSTDGDKINGPYLSALCANEWGLYKTLTTNLEKLGAFVTTSLPSDAAAAVGPRIAELRRMIEEQPKSLKWKMRAKIGEKAPWYILPEADKEVVDSRMPGTAGSA